MRLGSCLALLAALTALTAGPRAERALQVQAVELPSHLVWYDRTGKRLTLVDGPANERGLELSPDGTRATVTMLTAARRTRDIWMVDIATGSRTRFTDDEGDKLFSIWSHDGTRIVFDRDQGNGIRDLYLKTSTGPGTESVLFADRRPKWPLSFSNDGRFLTFVTVNPRTGQDIEVLPLTGTDRKPIPFQQVEGTESYPRFSPDGHWIAYGSDSEIYVAPFPGPGRRWQVSTGGGSWPRWSQDGKELFFMEPNALSANQTLMVASVSAQGANFVVGPVKRLFEIEPIVGGFYSYDVSADGQKFLVNAAIPEPTISPKTTLALNWPGGTLGWSR